MKISKILVENYRSIKKVEVEPNKFSIFIGQNNHGKTNFFEAIEWFYNAKSSDDEEHCQKDTGNKIQVEICFEDVSDSDIDKLTTDANKTKIRNVLGKATSFSVIKSSSDHKRRYFVNGEDKGNPQGLDMAINEFLPKLEYVNTKIRLMNNVQQLFQGYKILVQEGKTLEAIEKFYDPEILQFENTDNPLTSKETLYEIERATIENTDVSIVITNECFDELKLSVWGEMEITYKNKKKSKKLIEAFYQEWKEGKIALQKFFYKGIEVQK